MERYYNLDDNQKAAVAAGLTTAAGIGTALAQRGRRELSDIEKKCGKRPRNKAKLAEWQKCVDSSTTTSNQNNKTTEVKESWFKKNKNVLLIGGGILAIGIITLVVLKKRKK